jgi:hypothetical protein
MKSLIILFTLCLILTQISSAQVSTSTRYRVLSGKYTLDLVHIISATGETLNLEGNFPGLVKSSIDLSVQHSDGTSSIISLNKLLSKKNHPLYSSQTSITGFQIKSFQVQFTAFGENYSLQWTSAWGQFRVTKAGVDCNYANLATLENTSFQVIKVAPEQAKPLTTPFVVQVD